MLYGVNVGRLYINVSQFGQRLLNKVKSTDSVKIYISSLVLF